ncbi:MAG: hypothetical protein AAF228_06125 [Pseudomonadota bacterium]
MITFYQEYGVHSIEEYMEKREAPEYPEYDDTSHLWWLILEMRGNGHDDAFIMQLIEMNDARYYKKQ